jgi:hypothetical protein
MNFTRKHLFSLVNVLPGTGCWEFKGSRDKFGYGRMYAENREIEAHRVFYEAWIESVPDRFFLQHRLPKDQCIGHACCNPDHLQTALSAKGAPALIPADGTLIPFRVCPKGHLMTPENTVVEKRKGHPKTRCRTCRQQSWRKNSARRTAQGLHT